jgi:hypothetical protein
MGKDSATPDNITSLTKEFSFPDVGESVSFDLVTPEFIDERSTFPSGSSRCTSLLSSAQNFESACGHQ